MDVHVPDAVKGLSGVKIIFTAQEVGQGGSNLGGSFSSDRSDSWNSETVAMDVPAAEYQTPAFDVPDTDFLYLWNGGVSASIGGTSRMRISAMTWLFTPAAVLGAQVRAGRVAFRNPIG